MKTAHEEQVLFVRWLEPHHPEHWVYAVANGGHRHKLTAAKLKREGVRKGVPDLCIPSLFLYIEMKREKKSYASAEQKEWLTYLDGVGYIAQVCRGAEAAKELVTKTIAVHHFIDEALRARKAALDV